MWYNKLKQPVPNSWKREIIELINSLPLSPNMDLLDIQLYKYAAVFIISSHNSRERSISAVIILAFIISIQLVASATLA